MADRDHSDTRALETSAAEPGNAPSRTRHFRPFQALCGPRKRLRLALLFTIAMLLPLLPLSLFAANSFTDLNEDSVHNADIDTAYTLGIVNGLNDTTYDPNSPVTREQMASFVARTAAFDRVGFAAFTSAGADADLGAGPSKDYMTVNLNVPGRDGGQPIYVRVSFTGYAFAKTTDVGTPNPLCPCMLRGELRMDSNGKQIVTRSVVGASVGDYVGTPGAGGVADADRKDFSGSAVFLATPGQHIFTMSVTREIGTAENVGFAFGNMQAEVIPFGGAGTLNSTVLTATLNGASEVPGPGDADGSGTATISLNPAAGEVCYTITVSNIAAATAAHIHSGAAGASGPVVINFGAPASGAITGCTSAGSDLVQGIADNPAGFYVNVHNAEFPGGAVRGQLGE